MYKFFVFAPRNKKIIRDIIDAASKAGAGKIGKYNKCAFITEGIGTWIAEADAHPARGKAGQLENIKEVKIEMQFPDDKLSQVIKAVKAAHPYEEIVIDVMKIEMLK